jgi:hypothetical protein
MYVCDYQFMSVYVRVYLCLFVFVYICVYMNLYVLHFLVEKHFGKYSFL